MDSMDALFMALDYEDTYSFGGIVDFAVHSGFLDLIENKEPFALARQRLRINAIRFANTYLPREPDKNIQFHQGWFGWRWQGHTNIEEAETSFHHRIDPVLMSLISGKNYALADLIDSYRQKQTQWGKQDAFVMRALFSNYAWTHGLDVEKLHYGEAWQGGLCVVEYPVCGHQVPKRKGHHKKTIRCEPDQTGVPIKS
jgi:hypothetical protein